VAVLAIAAMVTAGSLYAWREEKRHLHALASAPLPQKTLGRALQVAALGEPDLLVVYGSSELMMLGNPYRGNRLFATYPSGFAMFTVGRGGFTTLLMLQAVADAGSALRGKKVAVSLSPPWFLRRSVAEPDMYAGNFSRLHAHGLAFSSGIGRDIKRSAAQRMLRYPRTLAGNSVLAFALEQLARDTPASRALYRLAWPLGKLEALVLRLQDHWHTLAAIRSHGERRPVVERHLAPIDWPTLRAQAEREDRLDHDRSLSRQLLEDRVPREDRMPARVVLGRLRDNVEWSDLELLLRALSALGARPLVLTPPIAGTFYDSLGVSRADRVRLYYDRLSDLGRRHGAVVASFADFDQDETILWDTHSHLSRKGWVLYAETLDRFYHDATR
jgi:D-alanine transfer protein